MPSKRLFSFLFFTWMALLTLLSLLPADNLDMDGPDTVDPATGWAGTTITTSIIAAGITDAGTDHGVRHIAGGTGGTAIRS